MNTSCRRKSYLCAEIMIVVSFVDDIHEDEEDDEEEIISDNSEEEIR